MIHFFRKIRHNLLAQGKTVSYLKYAVGEIVLVVIGILIALQINNWNETRKTIRNQEKYLKILKVETLNNLKDLNKNKELGTAILSWQNTVIDLINTNHDTLSENYLSRAFSKLFSRTFGLQYENSGLTEIRNAGELKNIKNDSLRKYLIALDPLVMKVQIQEQNMISRYADMQEYLVTQPTFRWPNNADLNYVRNNSTSSKVSYVTILEQVEFDNRFRPYRGTTNNLITNHYSRLENHLQRILDIIEKEIDEK